MDKIVTAFLCMCIISCDGSSSKDKVVTIDPVIVDPPALAAVEDYVIQDTDTILVNVSNELQGLEIEEFFKTTDNITVNRNVEALISDGGFDNLPTVSLHLFNIFDE